jgi:MFS family permease
MFIYIGASKSLIGLIGSMNFAGWTVASIILPRFVDLFGRKKIFVASMIF